jgi:hypothetical protein
MKSTLKNVKIPYDKPSKRPSNIRLQTHFTLFCQGCAPDSHCWASNKDNFDFNNTDAVPQPRWLSHSTRTEYISIYPRPGLSSSLVMSLANQTRDEFPFIPRPPVRSHRKRQSTRGWRGPRFNANEYPLKPVFSWPYSPCYCNYLLLD